MIHSSYHIYDLQSKAVNRFCKERIYMFFGLCPALWVVLALGLAPPPPHHHLPVGHLDKGSGGPDVEALCLSGI